VAIASYTVQVIDGSRLAQLREEAALQGEAARRFELQRFDATASLLALPQSTLPGSSQQGARPFPPPVAEASAAP
jgi:hypothetical protein